MTRNTNARLAGFTFLIYIATGVASMVLSGQTTSGAEGTAAKLASIAQHASLVRVDIVLTLLCAAYALVLAVTLYALTRDQDRDLAVMALCCRVGEGVVIAAVSSLVTLALLSVATAGTAAAGANAVAACPKHPRPTGLAGRTRVDPARGGPSPAARRIHQGPGDQFYVDANARV